VKAVVHAAAAVPLSLTTEVDVVVATVPALPNLLAGRVIAWLKGVPYVVDMRDAWPDLIAESETGGKLFGTLVTEAITKLQRPPAQPTRVTYGSDHTMHQRNKQQGEEISHSRGIEQMFKSCAGKREPNDIHVFFAVSYVYT